MDYAKFIEWNFTMVVYFQIKNLKVKMFTLVQWIYSCLRSGPISPNSDPLVDQYLSVIKDLSQNRDMTTLFTQSQW